MIDKEITIDKYRPEYGEGIARCFRAVYGDGYPVKIVYDPEALQAGVDKGSFYTVAALNGENEVIGVMGLYRSSSPYSLLYEIGAGIVLPEYRAQSIANKLCAYIYDRLAKEIGLEELFGEAVANHTKMQKISCQYENIEMGLEIDLMPAEAYTREKSSSGRVTTTTQFRCYKDKRQDVHVPEVYSEEFLYLYRDPKRERRLIASEARIPLDSVTSVENVYFESARVGRLMLSSIGHDVDSCLDTYEKDAAAKGTHVSQAFLKLDCPWVGKAVDILRSRGYFLAGILPRWFDSDGMLMQKVYGDPNWKGINLYSDRAKKILTFIRGDWEKTHC
jgi:hypothetical protein